MLLSGRSEGKLKAVVKFACVRCGEVLGARRKSWLKGAARRKDRRVYCHTCLCAEYVLENACRIDYEEKVVDAVTFGTVYEGYLVDACVPCAVKCMSVNEDMLAEVSLQRLCAHPNFLKVLGICESVAKISVALESLPRAIFSL